MKFQSPMFTKANHCFSIVFRGECPELQNNELNQGTTEAAACLHKRMQRYLKTPASHLSVDGKQFENRAFRKR